jgi:hypothetical protein
MTLKEKKTKLKALLKKYPKYKEECSDTTLVIRKNSSVCMSYQWKDRVLRSYIPLESKLFNEILEIMDN